MTLDRKFNKLIMMISAFLILFSLWGNTRINIAVFIALVSWFYFAKEGTIIADLFFLLPFSTVFKFAVGTTSAVTYLQVIAIVIIVFRKKTFNYKYLVMLLLFAIYIFLECLFIGQINIIDPLKIFFGFLMMYIVLKYPDNYEYKRITKSYLFGTAISSVAALFASTIPNFYLFVRKIGYNTVITNRFSGMNGDPNYYAIELALLLFAVFCMRKKNNSLFLITYIFVQIFGLMTYSKSFFLIDIVLTLLIIIDLIKRKKYKSLVLLTLLLSLFFIYMFIFQKNLFELTVNRFLVSKDINSLSSGRVKIWGKYLLEIFSSLHAFLFGHSFSADLVDATGAHSFYIELLYYIGLLGMLIYVFLLRYLCVVFCKKNHKFTFRSKSILIVFLLLVAFLQMLHSNELYFQLLLVLMTLQYCEEEKKYEKSA